MGQNENSDQGIIIPRYPGSITPDEVPTEEMVQAGWAVLEAEGLPLPFVETMEALWRAMYRAWRAPQD